MVVYSIDCVHTNRVYIVRLRKLVDSVLRLYNVVYMYLFGRPFLKPFKVIPHISVYNHCVQHVFCPSFLSRMHMSLFITAVLGCTYMYMYLEVHAYPCTCMHVHAHVCSLTVYQVKFSLTVHLVGVVSLRTYICNH